MKTKTLLLAAIVGAAAVSANAGVSFGISFGRPVVYSRPVVVVQTAAPAPIVEAVPACPGEGYVWAPGYWAYQSAQYVWVPGCWNFHRSYVGYGHHYSEHGGHYGGYRR